MRNALVFAAALALLTACASAEPVAEPTFDTPAEETLAEQIERLASEAIALQREGSLPADLQVSVLELDETPSGLFYKVELLTSQRREGENYVLYGQCPAGELPRCADQVVAAARMLRK